MLQWLVIHSPICYIVAQISVSAYHTMGTVLWFTFPGKPNLLWVLLRFTFPGNAKLLILWVLLWFTFSGNANLLILLI